MSHRAAPRTELTVGSLFSGIGGFDLGFERAGGFGVRWQVELDPFCRAVLAKHWPTVRRYEDVRSCYGDVADAERRRGHQGIRRDGQPTRFVDADWCRCGHQSGHHSRGEDECLWCSCGYFLHGNKLEPVEVICAGFPCQPVSLAGKQLGQADGRWLWPEVSRLVRELRPRYVALENVPGLLVRGFGDVLGDLAETGYDAEWTCIRAADVGAPHRRERVFVLAYPSDDAGQYDESRDLRGEAEQRQELSEASERDLADADGWRRESGGFSQPAGVASPRGRQSQEKEGLPEMTGTAVFDKTRRYRYVLSREWLYGHGSCVFIMLNPSTADETVLDPTVRRCVGFAKEWGFKRIDVLNLFAWRSTDPRGLWNVEDPIGPENDQWIVKVATHQDTVQVVCAWGTHGATWGRGEHVVRRLTQEGVVLWCLDKNKGGTPVHPLYQPHDAKLVPFGLRRERQAGDDSGQDGSVRSPGVLGEG